MYAASRGDFHGALALLAFDMRFDLYCFESFNSLVNFELMLGWTLNVLILN